MVGFLLCCGLELLASFDFVFLGVFGVDMIGDDDDDDVDVFALLLNFSLLFILISFCLLLFCSCSSSFPLLFRFLFSFLVDVFVVVCCVCVLSLFNSFSPFLPLHSFSWCCVLCFLFLSFSLCFNVFPFIHSSSSSFMLMLMLLVCVSFRFCFGELTVGKLLRTTWLDFCSVADWSCCGFVRFCVFGCFGC